VKFFLDHDVPADLAVTLRTLGHEAMRLVEVLPNTTPDPEVWAYARAHGLIVITCNRQDFLALATATEIYPGLIVLKRRNSRVSETSHVLALLRRAGEQGLNNNINFA
jgi:predicted nuclease of predicted toxin-antitoxin system